MQSKSGVSPEIMTALPRNDGASIETYNAPLSMNTNMGTFAYRIPFDIPPGRRKGELALNLVYEMRAFGNGVFGVGWELPQLAIQRRTDTGIPRYDGSDRFMLTDGTMLEPVGSSEYRPIVERAFRKIRFVAPYWEVIDTDGTQYVFGESEESRLFNPARPEQVAEWRISHLEDPTGNVIRFRYDRDLSVHYPEGYTSAQIYLRAIEYVNAPQGEFLNSVRLDYSEDRPDAWASFRYGFPVRTSRACRQVVTFTTNLDAAAPRVVDFGGEPFNVHSSDGTTNEQWLKKGFYLQGTPADHTLSLDFPIALSEVVLKLDTAAVGGTIGGHYQVQEVDVSGNVSVREEVSSAATLDVALSARVSRVTITALKGPLILQEVKLSGRWLPEIYSLYQLTYRDTTVDAANINPSDIAPPMLQLRSVQRLGYDASGNKHSLPSVELVYRPFSLNGIFPRPLQGTPNEPIGPETTLIQFFGTGRPDILQTIRGHQVYFNEGRMGTSVRVVRGELGESPDLSLGDSDVYLRDVRGRGAVDLTNTNVYYPNPSVEGTVSRTVPGWGARQDFDPNRRHPQLSTSQYRLTRSIDLNGNGRPDLLTTDRDFWIWRNEGEGGWSAGERIDRLASFGDRVFPDISFEDEHIHIADMNGDGLDEVVRVSARKVEYWVRDANGWNYLKTTMLNAPRFAGFDPRCLVFADLTGNGSADLIYVHANGVEIALNVGGERFADPLRVDFNDHGLTHGFPMPTGAEGLLVVDFLGDGVRGLLWSFQRQDTEPNYFFLPLSASGKPYLLTHVDNGIGGRIEVNYTTSSLLAAEDESAGYPWEDTPPYPVTVVSKVREIDCITGAYTERYFRYRNGYFDRIDHNFRGFSVVAERIRGNDYRRGLMIYHRFASGKPTSDTPLERARARALAGSEVRTTHSDLASDSVLSEVVREFDVHEVQIWRTVAGGTREATGPLRTTTSGAPVVFAHERRCLEISQEGSAVPRYALREWIYTVPSASSLVLEEFGRLVSEIQYGEVVTAGHEVVVASFILDGTQLDIRLAHPERQRRMDHEYATNRSANIVRHDSHRLTWQGPGLQELVADERFYYDGGTNRDDHLPLGEVAQGCLQRREVLVATTARLRTLFGPNVLAHMGADENTGPGFFLRDQDASGKEALFAIETRRVFAQTGGRIAHGAILSEFDARGAAHVRDFDNMYWYLRAERNALNHETLYEAIDYQGGKPVMVRDPNGVRTAFVYDAFGRELSVHEDADNTPSPQQMTSYATDTYQATGDPTSTMQERLIDAAEIPRRFVREIRFKDGWGRELQMRFSSKSNQSDFLVVSKTYDAGGTQPTFESSPYWEAGMAYVPPGSRPGILRHRDALGRVLRIEFPDGNVAQLDHGPWRVKVFDSEDMDPNSLLTNTPTIISYDHAKRPTQVEVSIRHAEGLGSASVGITAYDYDGAGQLVRIMSANSTKTSFEYDGRGKQLVVHHPDAGVVQRLFAADGTKIHERDATGTEWWYFYDELGRVKSEHVGAPSASPSIDYTYDAPFALGRLAHARNLGQKHELSFSYDARGNETHKIRQFGGAVVSDEQSFFNDLNRVKQRSFAGGSKIVTSYNLDGLPSAIHFLNAAGGAPIPLVEAIRYHTSGRVCSAQLLGGAVVYDAAFDAMTQRLTRRTYRDIAGTPIFQLDIIKYDNVGNITSFREHAPPAQAIDWQHEYDSLYRLRHAVAVQGGTISQDLNYHYDAVGNFVLNDEYDAGQRWNYDGPRPNAVTGTTAAPGSFAYDAVGRVIGNKEADVVRWNNRRRVDQVISPKGDRIDMIYSHDGRIVALDRTDAGGTVERSIFLAEDHERHGATDCFFANIEGIPWVAVQPDGTRTVYVRSLASSVVRELADRGKPISTSDELYAPFGSPLGGRASSAKRRGFAGALRGLGNVQLMGARPYQVGLGRFLAPDPVLLARYEEESLYEPQQHGPYTYALNNPRSFTDPTGELVFIDDAIFWGIGAFVRGAFFGGPSSLEGLGGLEGILRGIGQNFAGSWLLLAGLLVSSFGDVKGGRDVVVGGGELADKLTWGLMNEVLGITAGYFAIEFGGGYFAKEFRGGRGPTSLWQNVQLINVPRFGGAFTLGSKVIGSSTGREKHEQGHYYQNLPLGPFYIFVIGIPSALNYAYWNYYEQPDRHFDFYTEKWADAWS